MQWGRIVRCVWSRGGRRCLCLWMSVSVDTHSNASQEGYFLGHPNTVGIGKSKHSRHPLEHRVQNRCITTDKCPLKQVRFLFVKTIQYCSCVDSAQKRRKTATRLCNLCRWTSRFNPNSKQQVSQMLASLQLSRALVADLVSCRTLAGEQRCLSRGNRCSQALRSCAAKLRY